MKPESRIILSTQGFGGGWGRGKSLKQLRELSKGRGKSLKQLRELSKGRKKTRAKFTFSENNFNHFRSSLTLRYRILPLFLRSNENNRCFNIMSATN